MENMKLNKKLFEDLQRLYDDTMHQLYIEEKTKTPRNEDLIIRLKEKHMELSKMLLEMSARILKGN